MPGTVFVDGTVSITSASRLVTDDTSVDFNAATRECSESRAFAVARNAAAVATMPATFDVPLRRSRSCPPPMMSGSSVVPAFCTITPMPFGPPNLWADSDTTSVTSTMSRRSSQHAACTASLWKTAFGAASRTTRATSRIGVMLPTSLFTAITDTTPVRSPRCAIDSSAERSFCTSTTPFRSTSTTLPETCSTQCNTAWCSAALQTATPP